MASCAGFLIFIFLIEFGVSIHIANSCVSISSIFVSFSEFSFHFSEIHIRLSDIINNIIMISVRKLKKLFFHFQHKFCISISSHKESSSSHWWFTFLLDSVLFFSSRFCGIEMNFYIIKDKFFFE